MSGPGEEEAHQRTAATHEINRLDQGDRIEPVVETATPEQDFVIGPDAGHHASDSGCRALRSGALGTERHHGDQISEVWRLLVADLVDPADCGQLPEPEVALAETSTEEQVPAAQLLVDHVERVPDCGTAFGRIELAGSLERFQMEGVVEIDHDDRGSLRDGRRPAQRIALHDDDVGVVRDPLELRTVGVTTLQPWLGELATGGGDELHLVRHGQCPRHLTRSNRWPGKTGGQDLTGHHDDLAAGHVGSGQPARSRTSSARSDSPSQVPSNDITPLSSCGSPWSTSKRKMCCT